MIGFTFPADSLLTAHIAAIGCFVEVIPALLQGPMLLLCVLPQNFLEFRNSGQHLGASSSGKLIADTPARRYCLRWRSWCSCLILYLRLNCSDYWCSYLIHRISTCSLSFIPVGYSHHLTFRQTCRRTWSLQKDFLQSSATQQDSFRWTRPRSTAASSFCW